LVVGGKLNGVKITRIHLEEDTGRLTHNDYNDDNDNDKNSHSHRQKSSYSLVDFNRAGIPLMELVTEPDIESGKEAVAFAKELQLILRYLEISDADMEKGQLRVEVNLSISKNSVLGTKVEIQNLNSFKAVEESIDYEIKRQSEILEKGEMVKQETRGWDDIKKRTVPQRTKEEAHDYRYFPEPDLPPLDLTKFNLEELKISVPELPVQKRARFEKEYGLLANQTEILIEDRGLAQYFEESASELRTKLPIPDYQLLLNYFSSDMRGLMNEQKITVRELNITPENFADLIVLLSKGEISSRLAKDILKEMFLTGLDPKQIIQQKGLTQISDDAIIERIIEEITRENPKAVEDYKKGQKNALQFLIGQAMKKLKGRADPKILKEAMENNLL